MRLCFLLVVAALEATAVSLPLTALTGLGLAWPLIFVAVLLGWLSGQVARGLGPGRGRGALLAGVVVGGLVLPAAHLGGPLAALGALLPGSPGFLASYALLLLGLFLFWRGARLDTGDSAAVASLFGWSTAVGLGSMVVGAISGTGAPAGSPAALGHAVGLVGLGLMALALAHAQESAGGRLGGLSWRWLATLLAATVAVVAIAIIGTGLVGGGEGVGAARALIALLLLPLALVGGALAWLFLTFLAEPLAALIRQILSGLQLLQPPEPPPAEGGGPAAGLEGALATIGRLAEGATFLMALIPVAILVLVILLLRRRQGARPSADEERESLGFAASLTGDIRELLGRLRNPFERRLTGLRAAMAALVGDDPTTRARRAYVGLLLLLEGRALPRPAAQTPAEFAPAAAEAAGAPAPVSALTEAYEQARYSPAGASPADAAAAEAALRALERRPR